MTGVVGGKRDVRQAYKNKSKPTDIRFSNINAAKGALFLCTFLLSSLLYPEPRPPGGHDPTADTRATIYFQWDHGPFKALPVLPAQANCEGEREKKEQEKKEAFYIPCCTRKRPLAKLTAFAHRPFRAASQF
jgi:hypothetical protein